MKGAGWFSPAAVTAASPLRRAAVEILGAGLDAIETAHIVSRSVRLNGDTLTAGDTSWDLRRFRRIHVIGFGKASCRAAAALDSILDGRAEPGVIVGSKPGVCEHVGHLPASHPLPSPENVAATERMMLHCRDMREDDLVIVVVSGGGSAMLCWPMTECEQGRRLYADSLRTGMTIRELNTVRKHISSLKGGGLAKLLWPAHVLGLIFSDVPGRAYDVVASGPTFRDTSTAADAQAVLDRYGLTGYDLNETPADAKFFERVTNFVLVSNRTALEAMASRAGALGFTPRIIGDDIYASPEDVIAAMRAAVAGRSAVLAGGEFRIVVPDGGKGGRNTRAALTALRGTRDSELFIALASDGSDNTDAAGAFADAVTARHARAAGLDIGPYLDAFDDYTYFEKSGDLLFTGPTDANVSDLMLLLAE